MDVDFIKINIFKYFFFMGKRYLCLLFKIIKWLRLIGNKFIIFFEKIKEKSRGNYEK